MVLVGGFNTKDVMDDVWVFDVTLASWELVDTSGTDVDSFSLFRGYHSLAYHRDSNALLGR
jgi:hypothetical protein